jgi:hypothetical protein
MARDDPEKPRKDLEMMAVIFRRSTTRREGQRRGKADASRRPEAAIWCTGIRWNLSPPTQSPSPLHNRHHPNPDRLEQSHTTLIEQTGSTKTTALREHTFSEKPPNTAVVFAFFDSPVRCTILKSFDARRPAMVDLQ